MNQDRNKKRRKFDYVANLIDYSISLNRDNNVQIDYSFIKPQDLKKALNEYKEDSHFSKNNLRKYDKGGSFSVLFLSLLLLFVFLIPTYLLRVQIF